MLLNIFQKLGIPSNTCNVHRSCLNINKGRIKYRMPDIAAVLDVRELLYIFHGSSNCTVVGNFAFDSRKYARNILNIGGYTRKIKKRSELCRIRLRAVINIEAYTIWHGKRIWHYPKSIYYVTALSFGNFVLNMNSPTNNLRYQGLLTLDLESDKKKEENALLYQEQSDTQKCWIWK